jgi:MSHA biogenesis protein MshL
MLKKWAILFVAALFVLAACHSPVYNQTEGNIAEVVVKAKHARKLFDASGRPDPALLVKDGMYVDTTPISLERQPDWLKNYVVIRGDQLPFSYYSRTITKGAGNNVLTKYQSGLDPSINVTMSYTGTVKGALDLLAAKTGYVYRVSRNAVYWQAFVTKTYEIAFMPGGTDYLMGSQANSSGTASTSQQGAAGSGNSVSNFVTSDPSSQQYSNLKATLSIWKDLDTTIKQMLTKEGTVMVSESTTSVTVRDRPSNVELVGQYIHNLNSNLSKQVLVKVQILDVELQNAYDYGINWRIIANAFHNSPFVINGNYGTPVTITTLTPQPTVAGAVIPVPQMGFNPAQGSDPNGIPSYTILLNALNQQGKTSVVSEPRVVCLNNQVSVIRVVKQNGYAASVQNTTLSGGGSTNIGTVTSQITPGNLITGITLYILPKILKDKIFIQVNADLSTNDGFTSFTTGSGGSSTGIQLPNVTEKHFNQRSMIKSGDTLILSGFRQVGNTVGANQFLESQALGGKAASQGTTETIVLITPIVLNGYA